MQLLDEAQALFPYTQALRRDFHRHPELGFNEIRTSSIVAEELQKLGLDVTTGIATTGVVGLLRGIKESPVLLLRFDMDALPILEENNVDYVSQNPGVMHACGHDSHTAVGLTIAKILANHKHNLEGTIKFVFQPAEEGPGANADTIYGGAFAMVQDGVLTDPVPDFAMAMHVWNEQPVGWFGITHGPVMAGGDIVKIRISGKGGHGASPHLAIDPVLASAHVITALQSIVSRNVPPLESAVVSITHVEGGSAFNIIPPYVDMEGTIRTFLPEVHKRVASRFKEIVFGVAESMGCQAEISLNTITFPVINDPRVAALLEGLAAKMLTNVTIDTTFQTMGSEDMSFLMRNIPGCFILVGSANPEKGLDFGHHHPKFDIDETCLPNAIALLAQGSIDLLKNPF